MIFKACKNCEDRAHGCHGSCYKYQAEVAENEKEKAARQKENIALDVQDLLIKPVIRRHVLETKRRGR